MAETFYLRKRHRYERGYSLLDNAAADDPDVSLRAMGVLWWLWRQPDDYPVNSDRIAAKVKEGRDAVRTALNELAAAGYLRRTRVRGEGRRAGVWRTVVEVADQPLFRSSDDGFSGVGDPQVSDDGFSGVGKSGAKNPNTPDNIDPVPNGTGRGSADAAEPAPTTARTVMADWFDRHPTLDLSKTSRDRIGAWVKSALRRDEANTDTIAAALDVYADGLRDGRRLQPSHLAGIYDQVTNNGHSYRRRGPVLPERWEPTEAEREAVKRRLAEEQASRDRAAREQAARDIPGLVDQLARVRGEITELEGKPQTPWVTNRIKATHGTVERLEGLLAAARAKAQEGV
jgi:hypothetical protein